VLLDAVWDTETDAEREKDMELLFVDVNEFDTVDDEVSEEE
jgi:hypothetical protein